LTSSEKGFIRCAHPQMELIVDAMSSLGTKSTIVLDLVSLATLRLLGSTRQVLPSGATRFDDGQHFMTATTQEQLDNRKALFEEWMQCVVKNVTVLRVPELAAFDTDRRETLEKLLGREGLESAILSLRPGSILWTDDLAVAEIAKSELGTERVWTQAAIESLANRGLIDRSTADECHAKLLGFGFQSTHFMGATNRCRLANIQRCNRCIPDTASH
jgi:hypothetical protein